MSCCRKTTCPAIAASCCFFCRWDGPAAIESSCTGSRPWTQMQTQRRKWITVRLVGLWLLTGGGRKWVGLRERRERTCHLRRSNDQCNRVQLGGNRTDANFLAHCWGALSLLFRHRFSYSRLYRFVFLEEEGLALLFSVDLFVFDSLCLSTGNSIYSCFLLH